MTLFLPDTTFLIDLERRQPYARAFLRQCNERGDSLAVCLITLTEYYAGRLPGERPDMDGFLESAIYWEMDRAVGLTAARNCCIAQRRGIKIHVADALIAALAESIGATVVSENRRDFEAIGVPVLSLRNPSAG